MGGRGSARRGGGVVLKKGKRGPAGTRRKKVKPGPLPQGGDKLPLQPRRGDEEA
jgi:hypothetical protein